MQLDRQLTEAAVAVAVVVAATVSGALGVVSGDAVVGVWGTVLGYVFGQGVERRRSRA